MMDYQTFPIPSNFCIKIDRSPVGKELSDVLSGRVEEIWQEELIKRGALLHNGRILSVVSLENGIIVGRFVEYRNYLAQVMDPILAKEFNFCTLGMTGITFSGDHILIGRRAAEVTHYPLYYEFAPVGGVDPVALEGDYIDITKQALIELSEETGILERDVLSIKSCLLIRDSLLNTLEVCVRIDVDPNLGSKLVHSTAEYPELFWVSAKAIEKFIKEHEDHFVPTSTILYKNQVGFK